MQHLPQLIRSSLLYRGIFTYISLSIISIEDNFMVLLNNYICQIKHFSLLYFLYLPVEKICPMEKWFLDKLAEHYPFLLCIIVVAIGVTIIVWKASSFYHRLKKIETGHDGITPQLNEITKSVGSLSSSFNSLVTYLSGKDSTLNASLYVMRSPVQLTDLGTEILQIIGGKKYIDDNSIRLISEIEKQNFKSGLDIENYCKVILMKEFSSDSFVPIKNYMFQHPRYVKDNNTVQLDMPTVTNIMGIYLRNKYFEKHPELQNS